MTSTTRRMVLVLGMLAVGGGAAGAWWVARVRAELAAIWPEPGSEAPIDPGEAPLEGSTYNWAVLMAVVQAHDGLSNGDVVSALEQDGQALPAVLDPWLTADLRLQRDGMLELIRLSMPERVQPEDTSAPLALHTVAGLALVDAWQDRRTSGDEVVLHRMVAVLRLGRLVELAADNLLTNAVGIAIAGRAVEEMADLLAIDGVFPGGYACGDLLPTLQGVAAYPSGLPRAWAGECVWTERMLEPLTLLAEPTAVPLFGDITPSSLPAWLRGDLYDHERTVALHRRRCRAWRGVLLGDPDAQAPQDAPPLFSGPRCWLDNPVGRLALDMLQVSGDGWRLRAVESQVQPAAAAILLAIACRQTQTAAAVERLDDLIPGLLADLPAPATAEGQFHWDAGAAELSFSVADTPDWTWKGPAGPR